MRSRWKRPVNTSLFYFLQGILLYCEYQASTFDESKLPSHRFEAMDHFAKCFLILRLEDSQVEGGLQTAEEDRRGWRAVRVDLVSPPVDRYAFTLLGWSGSRVIRIIENEWKLGSCRKKVWVERNVLVVIQYILEVLEPQFETTIWYLRPSVHDENMISYQQSLISYNHLANNNNEKT